MQNLRPKPQEKFRCQPVGASNRGRWEVPAQQGNVQTTNHNQLQQRSVTVKHKSGEGSNDERRNYFSFERTSYNSEQLAPAQPNPDNTCLYQSQTGGRIKVIPSWRKVKLTLGETKKYKVEHIIPTNSRNYVSNFVSFGHGRRPDLYFKIDYTASLASFRSESYLSAILISIQETV